MIYSPNHNFLLLKNYKVGSTSVEVELSKILPDNAIVTPIKPENKNHIPRNYGKFYNHIPYSEIESLIDLSGVKAYVFVRNPYDVVLSDLFYNYKLFNNKSDIYEYRNFYMDNEMLSGSKHIYTKNNTIVVDKILKYENGLENEINPILNNHNIRNLNIKTFEKKFRPEEFNAYNFFSKKHLNKIYTFWEWEFTNLGYSKI